MIPFGPEPVVKGEPVTSVSAPVAPLGPEVSRAGDVAAAAEPEAIAMIQAASEQLKATAPQHRMSTLQDLNAGVRCEGGATVEVRAEEQSQRAASPTDWPYLAI